MQHYLNIGKSKQESNYRMKLKTIMKDKKKHLNN